MSSKEITKKKSITPDWLVQGVLSKIGDIFDNLTGRKWQPSSSLATSELIERLKRLLDAEIKDTGEKGKFVPHNLKLKMQWDKFSTDSEKALKKLENELLIAAVDHINDNRYQTYAPLKLEVKPDYFTEGVKLLASFEKFAEEDREIAVNVTVPEIKVGDFISQPTTPDEPEKTVFSADYVVRGKAQKTKLKFTKGKRVSVGRTRENDLSLDDRSVSRIHAALVLNSEGVLQVADTGSTNGTFINGQRIAYGTAYSVADADKVQFGTVEVLFNRLTDLPGNIYDSSEVSIEKDTKSEVMPDLKETGIDERKFQTTAFIEDEETEQKNIEPDENQVSKDKALRGEQRSVFDFENKH